MIRRYDFGAPVNTRAVVRELPADQGDVPFFTVAREDGSVSFALTLDELNRPGGGA